MLNVRYAVCALLSSCWMIAHYLPTFAQDSDPVAERLNLTRASGSLPLWEKPPSLAAEQLTNSVKSLHEGVFLIGNADEGYGTGFVISRKHRLLATNAHVADIGHKNGTLLAIRNGSSDVYQVENIWYHPGVIRKLDSSLQIRSQEPSDGEVLSCCPDVAVLRLGGNTKLPVEFELASEQEVYDAFAQPVAILGFPGHDTLSWPGVGQNAEASFDQGVISRVTDFYGNGGGPKEKSQFVRHTMTNWPGFSGSPIFLPNGHVILINNSMSTISKGSISTNLSYGIRIDCLWELLAYHGLDAQVPTGIERSKLDLARFEKENSQENDFRDAIGLISDAELLARAGKYKEASVKCNEAIKLAPGYADAYSTRAKVYNHYLKNWPSEIPHSEEVELANWSHADAKKALQLDPSSIDMLMGYATTLVDVKSVHNHWRSVEVPEVVALTSKILDAGIGSNSFRALVYATRASARGNSRELLSDSNEAIRLAPFSPSGYMGRATYWQQVAGDGARMFQDAQRAQKLIEVEQDTSEAFRLATSQNSSERNPGRALQLALSACEATQYKYWYPIQVLGIAYAETGQLKQSLKWLTEALKLAPDENKDECLHHLKRAQRMMNASQ